MRIVSVVIVIVLLNGFLGWMHNRPQDVGSDVPEGRLNSLSFAPFREGQSPLENTFPNPKEIEQDLRLLAEKTHIIRTYASAKAMRPIAGLAGKYGLSMIQGAWLGYGKQDNAAEIAALIESANTHQDVVKRVIVGNEVLLRGEMQPERLIEYIRKVKSAVKQPVSYADVWSMYMKYPQLIKEVDFITIHILPYWEDEPVPVDAAPRHIERIYRQVQREAEMIAPGKQPILIGESGWPGRGRQRGHAVPGIVNEARYIRGLIKTATENGFDYNIVEALNQPWKSELEGVAGANWGLFSIDRKQLFSLTGPVYENPGWPLRWLIATVIVLAAAIAYGKRLGSLNLFRLALMLGLLQLLSGLWVAAADDLWQTSYSFWQRFNTVFIAALNALMGGLIFRRAYALVAGRAGDPALGSRLYALYLLIAALAFYKTFGLATNGRYLGFPVEWVGIPVAGLAGLTLICIATERRLSWRALDINRLLGHSSICYKRDNIAGVALVFIGIAMMIGETGAFMTGSDFILAYPDYLERLKLAFVFTVTNGQLMLWLACLLVLAVSFLAGESKSANQGVVI